MELTKPLAPQEHEFSALKAGLTQFNELHTGPVFREKISSFVKDESGNIVGGILGEINWHWMHIQGLWVGDNIRDKGWGSKLLSTIEEYAISQHIFNIRLETTTFQALDFYIKAGYCVFGELPDMPKGYTSYFLHKQLSTPTP